MRILFFLLISASALGQVPADTTISNHVPFVQGVSGRVWNKLTHIFVENNKYYEWYISDRDTVIAHQFIPQNGKRYKARVTFSEIVPVTPLVPEDIDDRSPACVYSTSGSWTKFNNNAYSQTTATYTSTPGAFVGVTVTGGRLEIWAEKAKNKGTVQIFLKYGENPEVMVATVDLYANTSVNNSQKIYDSGVMAYGNYGIRMVLSGKNPSSDETNMLIDKFRIYCASR